MRILHHPRPLFVEIHTHLCVIVYIYVIVAVAGHTIRSKRKKSDRICISWIFVYIDSSKEMQSNMVAERDQSRGMSRAHMRAVLRDAGPQGRDVHVGTNSFSSWRSSRKKLDTLFESQRRLLDPI